MSFILKIENPQGKMWVLFWQMLVADWSEGTHVKNMGSAYFKVFLEASSLISSWCFVLAKVVVLFYLFVVAFFLSSIIFKKNPTTELNFKINFFCTSLCWLHHYIEWWSSFFPLFVPLSSEVFNSRVSSD
jgi:hypothetical protein